MLKLLAITEEMAKFTAADEQLYDRKHEIPSCPAVLCANIPQMCTPLSLNISAVKDANVIYIQLIMTVA